MKPHTRRVDDNQQEIVKELRAAGCTVAITSSLSGFVDIVVGYDGKNYLYEIKDGKKPLSQRKLTPAEEKFHAAWKGHVKVITCSTEALEEITSVTSSS